MESVARNDLFGVKPPPDARRCVFRREPWSKIRSKDVIHALGVPELRVKQDAIPGLTIPIWFVPNVTTAEMRTRTGNPEFQYEIARAALRFGPFPDAGVCHRSDRGGVPEVAGRTDRGAERTGSLPVGPQG